MTVLHLIDNLAPGGAERVMVNACNWLNEADCHVEAILIVGDRRDLGDLLHQDIPLHILGRRSRFDWRAAARLAALMRRANIVHVHMRHNYRYAALVAKVFGVYTKLILHDHSSSPATMWGLNSVFKPRFYVGTSTFSIQYAHYQLRHPEHTFLLENAVEAFPEQAHSEQKGIVLVSNIKPIKNQEFSLRLAPFLPDELHCYGAVQDFTYYDALLKTCRAEGLENRVFFHTNYCHIPAVLGDYRLGLHVSPNETGPLAVIEYLAQGLPFLAYRTGAAAYLIGREFPEYFIDHFEPEGWAERIRQLIAVPPDRIRMKQVFECHFSKTRYVSQCLEIYRHILAS